MTGRLTTGLIALALAIAAGCGSSTLNPPKPPEPSLPPTSNNETPPEPCTQQPDPFPDLDAAAREALSVVEKYVAAITARDEPAAARYICSKEHGGMLWVSSAGKQINVRDVTFVDTRSGHVRVEIQVEGKPPSPVVLRKVSGTWCVWL